MIFILGREKDESVTECKRPVELYPPNSLMPLTFLLPRNWDIQARLQDNYGDEARKMYRLDHWDF